MASNTNATSPAEESTTSSLGRESVYESPYLTPLQLPSPQIPTSLSTTAGTLRRIFEDNSLSHEEQDSFVESLLAIVRLQPIEHSAYQPEDEEDSGEEYQEVLLNWVHRVMAEYDVGISSNRDDLSAQQAIRMEIPVVNKAYKNKKGIDDIGVAEENKPINTKAGETTASQSSDSDDESDLPPIEEHFMIWEHPEVEAELAWNQTLGRNILMEHFALFKCCIAERIRYCVGKEKRTLYQALTESQIAWLTEPVPEDSGVKVPEKEQVWVVIWSVIKFARLILRAGGGAVQENTLINEYVAIMVAAWWLVRGEPFQYINKAQKGGPEVYMTTEGWMTSKEPWATAVLKERLGGTFEEVRERTKARKEAEKAAGGGETDLTKPYVEEDADVLSARGYLIKGILGEALMNTTRKSDIWSDSVEEKWEMSRAGAGADSQGHDTA
ncbi:hypothetical protein TWF718_000796 [Orbilia javanica]|uniref:Uncharacterized protein n=1 Tax=Orbilia javanica TaxID=47235 RepID=A0AAN8MUG4_9PEZI